MQVRGDTSHIYALGGSLILFPVNNLSVQVLRGRYIYRHILVDDI